MVEQSNPQDLHEKKPIPPRGKSKLLTVIPKGPLQECLKFLHAQELAKFSMSSKYTYFVADHDFFYRFLA